jgi:hypothetical protein
LPEAGFKGTMIKIEKLQLFAGSCLVVTTFSAHGYPVCSKKHPVCQLFVNMAQREQKLRVRRNNK